MSKRKSDDPKAPKRHNQTTERTELKSKRTATSATYKNRDGSRTTTLFATPKFYKSGRSWESISEALVPATDGYAWTNEANAFDLSFKKRLGSDYLRLVAGGRAFTMSLHHTSPVPAVAPGTSARKIEGALAVGQSPSPAATAEAPSPSSSADPAASSSPSSPGPGSANASTSATPGVSRSSTSPTPGRTSEEPSPEPSALTSAPPSPSKTSPAGSSDATAEPSPAPTAAAPTAKSPDHRRVAGTTPSQLAYLGAFPGVDIRYDSVADGVKETLVLNNADVPARYEFTLQAAQGRRALGVHRLRDGSYAIVQSPSTKPLFVIQAPTISETPSGHEVTPSLTDPVSMTVRPDGQSRFKVELSVNRRWLTSPARHFPLLLDPTLTIQPTVEDASFAATCGNCTPMTQDRVYVGASNTSAWRAALRFDLADIPAGVSISSAQLKLYYDRWCISANTSCTTQTQQIDVHEMTSPWSTSSQSSQLTYATTPLSSYSLNGAGSSTWMNWDVSNLLTDWYSGAKANNGLLVKRTTEALGSGGPVPPGRRYADTSVSPKLEVTYASDAVDLLPPDTLHANGADLSWTRYTGAASGAPFQRYEIHRSLTGGFTPSTSTLLATVADINTTTYRDTTAAPNQTFTYKVVANSSVSNPQTVTLPADGRATKFLQPDVAAGRATNFSLWSNLTNCANYGNETGLWAGTYVSGTANSKWRSALSFGLTDVPAGATIDSAKLSLYQAAKAGTVDSLDVHRVTRAWVEGTGLSQCSGDGATWYTSDGKTNWTSQGGDYASAPVATAAPAASGWDTFEIKSAVQQWVNGSAPNFGVLVKAHTETMGTKNYITWQSDDYTVSPNLRPKLDLTYADGSHAQGPTVSLASPSSGEKVSGNVTLTAAASDDRRVDKVEFFADGASIAVDTSAPYQTTWTTTTADNGSRALTAVATDDAGNTTTSTAVQVTVRNSNPPTVAVSTPSAGATVNGTVTVSADASDDVGLDRVEFFVDGTRIGAPDTTSPYSVSWNTLDPALTVYDGGHDLTARAYDSDGQVTVSAARTVTVANAAGTTYDGPLTGTAVPQSMLYDPAAGSQQTYGVDVTALNNSPGTWSASDVVLRYRWINGDGTVAYTSGDFPFAGDVRRGRTGTKTVLVTAPVLPTGVDRGQYELRIDLYSKAASTYFSAMGNPSLANPVIVNKAIEATALGLERYYQYDQEQVGAGMSAMTNLASGNALLNWTPWAAPGRGLSTVLGLTYNSLEDHSDSPVGNNFSLAISSLSRLGLPLDIHPNKADTIAGNAKKYIEFTDGDGTTHRFNQNVGGGWDEPAGVHLYLRRYSTTDLTRSWAITRPDRVTFFYDDSGFPTFVEDKNGNDIAFTYQDVPAGEDPGGVKRRIVKVTDAAGLDTNPAPNRSFTIDYYSKSDASTPHVRGLIQQITDHNGSALDFDYYEDGNLRRITQRGGTTSECISTSDRSWTFTYTTSDGSAAAIPAAADRVDPDPKTPNQSTRLFSVRGPRGDETTFTYYGPGTNQLRWKLESRTNRAGDTTNYDYDITNRKTTATAPMSRATVYAYDTSGQVTSITNPKSQTTDLQWSADRNVTKVTEPTGAYTEYKYDDNGYTTDIWDQLRHHTVLTYESVAVDANDVSAQWKTGRTVPHISQLSAKTSPRGTETPTPGDYQWDFGYDAKGNVLTATQPDGAQPTGSSRYVTTNVYNGDGTLANTVDPRGNRTTYDSYDANGLPTQVTDAKSRVVRFGYDADGRLVWTQDPRHANNGGGDPTTYRSYTYYDAFGRPHRQSTPKSTATNAPLIWTAMEYDRDDNPTASYAPAYGQQFVAGPKSSATYDAMDRQLTSTNEDSETTANTYDAAGRLTSTTSPKGVATTGNNQDYAVLLTYDPLDRVTKQTRYDTSTSPAKALNTHMCYDLAGDLVSRTSPLADVDTINCTSPPAHTTSYTYNADHQLKTTTDPAGNVTSTSYDADHNPVTSTDADNHTTRAEYDPRNLVTKTIQPLTSTRDITSINRYDGNANLVQQVSPRGYDASADKQTFTQFSTSYTYDTVDQLTKITLPTKTGDTPTYVYRDYDSNGNPTTTTLPDTATTQSGVLDEKKTTVSYFDTGWVASTNDHVNPVANYDYNARGQQTYRQAGSSTPETWTFAPDGMMTEHRDRQKDGVGGQRVTYSYNANNQLTAALERAGLTTPDGKPIEIQLSYDTLDRLAKTRQRAEGATNFTFTRYTYDLDGRTVQRGDDGTETDAGSQVTAPTKHLYTYDNADRLINQDDYLSDGCQQITSTYTAVGLEATKVIRKATQACDASPAFSIKQSVKKTYYDNNQLKSTITRSGALDTGNLVESHDVAYVDGASNYVNGQRVTDTFTKKGPASDCNTSACVATYTYDARDRLIKESRNPGPTISYTLDDAGNITKKATPTQSTFYDYTGMQLNRTATGTASNYISKNHYDDEGNLDCVTTPSFSGACGAASASDLLADYSYDYLNRLSGYQSYSSGSVADETSYEYDPLDRITKEVEKHPSSANRTTTFGYLGASNLVTKEAQAGDNTRDATKTYTYDAFGQRISLTNKPNDTTKPTETFTYGYDPHSSVSSLISSSGTIKASYGYDAYGQPDTGLTAGDPQNNTPLNPYRYTGKRYDPGSKTLDMGARRFGLDTSRYLQADQYAGALDNLKLSTDPLTGNRYALAGGNPLNFIEVDGHRIIEDIYGNSSTPLPTAHTAALRDSAERAKEIAPLRAEYDEWPGRLTVDLGKGGRKDNTIPGAHRLGTGGPGVADMIYWTDTHIYVWEIKNANERPSFAERQLRRYMEKLQDLHPDKVVEPGWELGRSDPLPSREGAVRVDDVRPKTEIARLLGEKDIEGMRWYTVDHQWRPPAPRDEGTHQSDDGIPWWLQPFGGVVIPQAPFIQFPDQFYDCGGPLERPQACVV